MTEIRYLSQVMTGRPTVWLLNHYVARTTTSAHRKYNRVVHGIEQIELTQVCMYPARHGEHAARHWIAARGWVKHNGKQVRVMLVVLESRKETDLYFFPHAWFEEIHTPDECRAACVVVALKSESRKLYLQENER